MIWKSMCSRGVVKLNKLAFWGSLLLMGVGSPVWERVCLCMWVWVWVCEWVWVGESKWECGCVRTLSEKDRECGWVRINRCECERVHASMWVYRCVLVYEWVYEWVWVRVWVNIYVYTCMSVYECACIWVCITSGCNCVWVYQCICMCVSVYMSKAEYPHVCPRSRSRAFAYCARACF